MHTKDNKKYLKLMFFTITWTVILIDNSSLCTSVNMQLISNPDRLVYNVVIESRANHKMK